MVLASFDQVIASYEYEDYRALKLFWNGDRDMLAAGFSYFKFSFWNYPVDEKRIPAKKNHMQSTNNIQGPIDEIQKSFKFLSQMRWYIFKEIYFVLRFYYILQNFWWAK